MGFYSFLIMIHGHLASPPELEEAGALAAAIGSIPIARS